MESLLGGLSHYENVSSLSEYLYTSFSAYARLLEIYEKVVNTNITGERRDEGPGGSSSYLYPTQEESIYNSYYSLTHPDCQKWIFSIIGCLLVGLSGIFPLFIIPIVPTSTGESSKSTKYTLDTTKPSKSTFCPYIVLMM